MSNIINTVNETKVIQRDVLGIYETASGEILLKDMDSPLWWRVPTEQKPIDLERLEQDCKAICAGTDQISYLEYIGVHDLSGAFLSDDRYARFVGLYPFGIFRADTLKLRINPTLAGPDNLRLFGMEDQALALYVHTIAFHMEVTRVCRKIMGEANAILNQRDRDGWLFRAKIANSIQDVRLLGLTQEFGNNTEAWWFKESVWETLTVLCQLAYPENPARALWLYIAAYELDGVYLPIPEHLIEGGVKNDSCLLLAVNKHAAKEKGLEIHSATDDGLEI